MRVLVCGSRNWTDPVSIIERLAKLGLGHTIVHGSCRGADVLAEASARMLKLNTESYPADWLKHGHSSSPIESWQMLDTGIDLVIAFHENIEQSRGTKDCVSEARRRGIAVEIIDKPGPCNCGGKN